MGIESVRPYKLVEGEALYAIRPPVMQIDQFLPVGGVMGMTALPGVGKTWLALEAARAVSSGTLFLGRYKTMRGGVLFIGSDSSLEDYAYQWTRLTRATPDAVEVFEPVRFLIQDTFMLDDRDEIRRLIRTHQTFEWGEHRIGSDGPEREHGFHLIIVDTLASTMNAQENDNSEMSQVFRFVRLLAAVTNCAVVLLHHNSKKTEFNDGSDWRGATSMRGALDSWVNLVPHRRDPYLIGVQYKKFRGIKPEDFAFRMAVSDPETASLTMSDEPVTTGQRMQFDPLATSITEYVVANPGKRASEIRDALWEKFSAGVDAGGATLVFDSKLKMIHAVNNRLNALIGSSAVRRSVSVDGKPVYYEGRTREEAEEMKNLTKLAQTTPTEELADQVEEEATRPSTRTSARRATGGMSTERSRRARKHQKDAVRSARKAKAASREEPRSPRAPRRTSGA